MTRHVVAAASDIAAGDRKLVDVAGRGIVIFNLGGEFFALADRCPHQAGQLSNGKLCGLVKSSEPGVYEYSRQGEMIRCPWHSWEFDVRTGQSWCEPSRIRTRRYDVKVEHGADVVEGPYVAETFKVAVENDYLVIEI
jgi:nitrite reductase/ring-hydroxylating ferredoxin subunit